MGMVVRTNTMAQNAFRQLGLNNNAVSKSLEKLSSGYRINRAGDDAAGLAISEKMKAQIKGLETASSNAQDGISLIQTAEGALSEVHNMLNRMVELSTKSANGTYSSNEREALQAEVDSLLEEIDRVAESTNFNGIRLLDGTLGFNSEAFSINNVDKVAGKTAEIADSLFPSGVKYTQYKLDGGNLTTVEVTDPTTIPEDATFITSAPEKVDLETDGKYEDVADKLYLEEAVEDEDFHLTKDGTQTAPSFELDFADIEIKASAADQVGKFNLKGTATDPTELTTATMAKDDVLKGADLAANIAKKINDGDGSITFEGAKYTVTAEGTKLKFTFKSGAEADDAEGIVTEAVKSPTGKLTYAEDATATVTVGSQFHDTIAVVNPIVPQTGGRAGITFDMSDDANPIVEDGNRLTIDGTTFVFKTSKESSAAAGKGEILVDVSDKTNPADQLAEAIDIMSHHETANFKIESSVEEGKIHIDQKVNNKNIYDTRDSLTSLFTLSKGAQAAGTAITLTQDKLVAGNSLNIGGKTYTFGKNVSVGATAEDTLKNLKAALYRDGLTSAVSGSTITVYSNDASSKLGPSTVGGGLALQIGDTGDDYNMMMVKVADMDSSALLINDLDITNADGARLALDTVKNAINMVSETRASLGAMQNRLDYTINNLDTAAENMSAANSRIRDTDMAKEMMNYTQMNILTQAAQAMLAQANQQPQAVLQLLQ